jgi:hypothetical protein
VSGLRPRERWESGKVKGMKVKGEKYLRRGETNHEI